MKAPSSKRNKGRYCLFHQDRGHTTLDCFDPKEEVKDLIRRDYLKEYLDDSKVAPNSDQDDKSPVWEIKTILRGHAGGEFGRKRKTNAKEARVGPGQHEIYQTFFAGQVSKIEFYKEEVTNLLHPHNNALVITLKIAIVRVHKILVDGGSSVHIISLAAYEAMGLGDRKLKSSPAPLIGFGGKRVIP